MVQQQQFLPFPGRRSRSGMDGMCLPSRVVLHTLSHSFLLLFAHTFDSTQKREEDNARSPCVTSRCGLVSRHEVPAHSMPFELPSSRPSRSVFLPLLLQLQSIPASIYYD